MQEFTPFEDFRTYTPEQQEALNIYCALQQELHRRRTLPNPYHPDQPGLRNDERHQSHLEDLIWKYRLIADARLCGSCRTFTAHRGHIYYEGDGESGPFGVPQPLCEECCVSPRPPASVISAVEEWAALNGFGDQLVYEDVPSNGEAPGEVWDHVPGISVQVVFSVFSVWIYAGDSPESNQPFCLHWEGRQ